jgi:hypothetical protein
MTTIKQKQEIVQSLSSLDAAQSEKVLHYIQTLLRREKTDDREQSVKSKAMKEIDQALRQARLWI